MTSRSPWSTRAVRTVAIAFTLTWGCATTAGIGGLPGWPARAEAPGGSGSGSGSGVDDASDDGIRLADRDWRWPLATFRITEHYVQPAHAYGPGHRGVDLVSATSTDVLAPASGIVAFAGSVAGRGILTIDHGDGLVTTLEPVSTTLLPGDPVERGSTVAIVASGGHADAGELHFGVREDGEYINPLVLLGGVPRAVLLPCC